MFQTVVGPEPGGGAGVLSGAVGVSVEQAASASSIKATVRLRGARFLMTSSCPQRPNWTVLRSGAL